MRDHLAEVVRKPPEFIFYFYFLWASSAGSKYRARQPGAPPLTYVR
jgi:hypothetical protein